jgi:hypothetical protein
MFFSFWLCAGVSNQPAEKDIILTLLADQFLATVRGVLK